MVLTNSLPDGVHSEKLLLAFAFDIHRPEGLATAEGSEVTPGVVVDAYAAGLTGLLHACGGIHGVAPDIVLIFTMTEHASDDGTDMDSDAELPARWKAA